MTFKQELILVLVDKGLLAIMLAVIGYFLQILTEKYKLEQANNSDIMKLRLNSMNSTIQKVNEWIIESAENTKPQLPNEFEKAIYELKKNSWKAIKEVEKNKFLNGKEFTNDLLNHIGKYLTYYENLSKEDLPPNYYESVRKESITIDDVYKKYRLSLK